MNPAEREPAGTDAFGIDPDRGYAARTQPGAAGAAPEAAVGVDDWKRLALEEFKQWLEELRPNLQRRQSRSRIRDAVDRATCMTCSRSSPRSARRCACRTGSSRGRGRELANAAARLRRGRTACCKARDQDLAAFENRVARAAENNCLRPVLDLRDALVRGRGAAVRLRKAGGIKAAKGGKGGKGGKRPEQGRARGCCDACGRAWPAWLRATNWRSGAATACWRSLA